MTGIYPVQVQTYLKRIGVSKSPICLHCSEGVPETLTHFACVCPKFREARTSAHNQVRTAITLLLHSILGPEWELFEETPVVRTGLTLRSTPQATVDQLGRRQPDWIAISAVHKRIAIMDLCRPSDVLPAQDSSDTELLLVVDTHTMVPRPSKRGRQAFVAPTDRPPLTSNFSSPISPHPLSLVRLSSARSRVHVRVMTPNGSTRHRDRARVSKLSTVQPVQRGKATLSGNKVRLSQKRTQCSRVSLAGAFDTDDPNQRPNERTRHESDNQELEPRGRRRT